MAPVVVVAVQVLCLRLRSSALAGEPLPGPQQELDYPTLLNRCITWLWCFSIQYSHMTGCTAVRFVTVQAVRTVTVQAVELCRYLAPGTGFVTVHGAIPLEAQGP